jgi:type I restriction enzyme M protein
MPPDKPFLRIKDGTYLCYDGACGTGGMLTIAEERLSQLAKENNKQVSVHLYGQESQPETYAIAKADLLLKGDGKEAGNIYYGSTLSNDGNATMEFDFMLSNLPILHRRRWKPSKNCMHLLRKMHQVSGGGQEDRPHLLAIR